VAVRVPRTTSVKTLLFEIIIINSREFRSYERNQSVCQARASAVLLKYIPMWYTCTAVLPVTKIIIISHLTSSSKKKEPTRFAPNRYPTMSNFDDESEISWMEEDANEICNFTKLISSRIIEGFVYTAEDLNDMCVSTKEPLSPEQVH
jgi:hypothetical protein